MDQVALTQQARIAILEGRLAQARSLLRQIVREDPYNYAAWQLLAQATPNPEVADQYRRRAQIIDPAAQADDVPPIAAASEQPPTLAAPRAVDFNWRPALVIAGLLVIIAITAVAASSRVFNQVAALPEQAVAQDVAAQPGLTGVQDTRSTNETAASADESKSGPDLLVEPTNITGSENQAGQKAANAETLPDPETESSQRGDAGPPVVIAPQNPGLPAAIVNGIAAESAQAERDLAAGNAAVSTTDPGTATIRENRTSIQPTAADVTVEEDSAAALGDVVTDVESGPSPVVVEEDIFAGAPADSNLPTGIGPGERWIDVNLSTQTLVAYEGETPVLNSLISSGMWEFPTVTGQFETWIKYESQNMTGYHLGYNYAIPDVPYVMYFYRDFAIHGAYWHNNFGTPMSHGCVNVNVPDAGWLFEWAPLGTVVNVHH